MSPLESKSAKQFGLLLVDMIDMTLEFSMSASRVNGMMGRLAKYSKPLDLVRPRKAFKNQSARQFKMLRGTYDSYSIRQSIWPSDFRMNMGLAFLLLNRKLFPISIFTPES